MKNIKCIRYPKLRQFRDIIREVSLDAAYSGDDENGDPIYDGSLEKPTLIFDGAVKVHGTNFGLNYTKSLGMWVQSRRVAFPLTVESSPYGMVDFVNNRKDLFMEVFNHLDPALDLSKHTATIYGEFAGKGVQSNVGVSNLDKTLFVFGLRITNNKTEESRWISSSWIGKKRDRVYPIQYFTSYKVEIDFNNPQLAQNTLAKLTQKVEDECPVALALGHSGIGEGIVWTAKYKDKTYRFKVKGEKHSVTKVKTLAPVDIEKIKSIDEFVQYSMTHNRLLQAISELNKPEEEVSTKDTGDVLKWLVNDIHSEESDTLEESGLSPRDVNKYISGEARKMFFKYLDEL